MYFRRFKKHQRSKLILCTILSLLLGLTCLAKFYTKESGIQIPNNLSSIQLSFYIPICLLCLGLFFWTIKKWYEYQQPIQERIYKIYYGIESSSVPKRIRDVSIKTQIIRLFLKRNNLLYQNKIEQIINTLKYESELPIYQFRFTKIFNSFSLILLGAFVGEALKPDSTSLNTQSNLHFNQAFEILKLLLAMAIMIWLVAWIIEMTMVKHIYGGWVNKHYKIRLIRALQEIKLGLDE